MEVYLDTQQLEEAALGGGNLEEILSEIMNAHLPVDRTITEVKIDGETYSETAPRDAAGVSRESIGRLDVLTVPLKRVAEVLLQVAPAHLETLKDGALEVADELRIGDEAEANGRYLLFLEALQDFFHFLGQATGVLATSLAHLEAEGLSASEKLRSLTSVLTDMVARQEDQDWILLADLLEYELAPILEDWKTILGRVKTVTQ